MQRQRLSYASVTSTLALILALAGTGGAAYALGKNTVGSPQIKNGQVKTKDLGKTSVATKKIKKSAVTGSKVKNGSLSGRDLHPRASGVARAGATVMASGNVVDWFNRAGGRPTVQHLGTGDYVITIPGVVPHHDGPGIVAVTGIPFWANCRWAGRDSNSFLVHCYNAAGTKLSSSFSVVVFKD